MARKKVKLAWITNDAARRATFKKRKKGIMKKVSELSTLCGVSACAIVYGPYEADAEVWPSASDAKRVLARFKSLPDMEQCKKMMNQEEFLRQRITKLKEQLKRLLKENQEKENTKIMYQCLADQRSLDGLGVEALGDLVWLIDDKTKAIRDRMELLMSRTPAAGGPACAAPPPPPLPLPLPSQYVAVDFGVADQKMMKMTTREAKSEPGGGGEEEDNKMMMTIDQLMAMEQQQGGLHLGQLSSSSSSSIFMDMNHQHHHRHVIPMMMNHNIDHVSLFPANDLVMPYVDNLNSWTNVFFP